MPVTLSDEELAQLQQLANQQVKQREADSKEIIRQGRGRFGGDTFDVASRRVVDAFGPQGGVIAADLIRGHDSAPDLLMKIADQSDEDLKAFARLTPERRAAKVASWQNQMAPSGYGNISDVPAWNQESVRTRPTDRDWARTYGAELDDDQWNAEFDRRMAERARSKGYRVP